MRRVVTHLPDPRLPVCRVLGDAFVGLTGRAGVVDLSLSDAWHEPVERSTLHRQARNRQVHTASSTAPSRPVFSPAFSAVSPRGVRPRAMLASSVREEVVQYEDVYQVGTACCGM